MIARACEDVRAWASEQSDAEEVEIIDRPRADADGPALVTWLFAIRPGSTVREADHDAYRATCRFLITAVDDRASRCHELVGRLLTAALQHASFEVEPEEPPWSLWEAAGLAPRPAFVLRADAVVQVERPAVPRVRTPLEVRHAALIALHGRVLGPGEVPMSGAEVEVADSGLRTRTDQDGRFTLASVPSGHAPTLTIRSGSRRYAVTAHPTAADEPLTIHLQAKEA